MFRVLTLRQSNLFWSSELLCNSDKFLVLVILWFKCRIQGNFRTSLETSFLFICRILCKFFETIATAWVILFISSVTSFVQNPVSVVTNSKQRHCATFWQAGSFEVQNYFLFSLQPAQNLNQFWKLQRYPYPFFPKVALLQDLNVNHPRATTCRCLMIQVFYGQKHLTQVSSVMMFHVSYSVQQK